MLLIGEAVVVFFISAVVCLAAGRVVIPILTRLQGAAPVRYEDCPPLLAYQQSKRAIPTMGGLFVLGTAVVMAVAAGGLQHRDGWLVLGAVASLAAVGLLDDYLKFRGPNAVGIRSMPKLLLALIAGGGIGAATSPGLTQGGSFEVPWLGQTVALGWTWIPFAMLVMAACAHSVNLTDGLDGLAAGCVAIALTVLGVWIAMDPIRHRVLLPWCASLSGACVGFLWFNSFPASIFLGDIGAMGLGGALGAISLLAGASLWLLIIGGVFVAEALSVLLQVASYKWRGKRRIFRVAPLHHHFHLSGTSEPKLIVRFWIIGLLLAALGLTRAAP